MKNPSGYGTVYKLSGRRRRPWVARVTTGWKKVTRKRGRHAGKEMPQQIYQIIGYFETKPEALAALGLHQITPVSPKQNLTLAELYAEWSAIKYKNITKATENNYRAAWKYLQSLEQAKVKDIRTSHWQEKIEGCKDQGLSKSTLQKIRTLAVMLSDHALKNDIIGKNYAKLVDMPKFEEVKKERFSDLEVKKIEDAAANGVPWADTVLMLIYTGFRISEFLAITRFNVDLDRGLITGGAKTEAGRDRPIPISPKIFKYVKAWLDRGGDALICRDGKKMTAKYYREQYYYPALEAMKVRRLTPHACRHTFCSRLADAGVDPLYIQRLAGHAQYAFTADKYTHPEIEKLRQAIGKL